MTYNEFLEKLKEYRDNHYDSNIEYGYCNRDGIIDSIYSSWTTGGRGGGSCWDTKTYELDCEKEPNSEDWLLDFIGELEPTLTFVQARKINKMWKETEHNDHGYYGNSRYFSTKTIMIKDIHDFLYGETE